MPLNLIPVIVIAVVIVGGEQERSVLHRRDLCVPFFMEAFFWKFENFKRLTNEWVEMSGGCECRLNPRSRIARLGIKRAKCKRAPLPTAAKPSRDWRTAKSGVISKKPASFGANDQARAVTESAQLSLLLYPDEEDPNHEHMPVHDLALGWRIKFVLQGLRNKG